MKQTFGKDLRGRTNDAHILRYLFNADSIENGFCVSAITGGLGVTMRELSI